MKKTVCHISTVHPAGDPRIFFKQCRALAESGYDVVYITADRNYEDAALDVNGIRIEYVSVPGRRLFRLLLSSLVVAPKCFRLRADVYHIHDPELIPLGMMLRLAQRTVIYDAHEDLPSQILQKSYIAPMVRQFLAKLTSLALPAIGRIFSAVVTATPTVARRFADTRHVVVRNFPAVKSGQIVEKPDDVVEIIYVGGISRIRGISELVHAFTKSRFQYPARLTIIGDCDNAELAQELSEMSARNPNIDFLGRLPYAQTLDRLRTAHIGICTLYPTPNHIDSLPVKFFEYLAFGLAVIASRGLREIEHIVEQWPCALLVDPKSPEEIAEALMCLVDNEELRQKLASTGSMAFVKEFNWHREKETLLALYHDLLAQQGALPPAAINNVR